MNVILLERVDKVGGMGEIVRVRDGFARNFLIPQGKALRANKSALEAFERRRSELEAIDRQRREDAAARSLELEGQSVVIIRQASETKQLYGSVTARDVAEAFKALELPIDRREVHIDTPIKTLGIFDLRLVLHADVEAAIQVNVARSQEEADIQSGKIAAPGEEDEGSGFTEERVDELPGELSFDQL